MYNTDITEWLKEGFEDMEDMDIYQVEIDELIDDVRSLLFLCEEMGIDHTDTYKHLKDKYL